MCKIIHCVYIYTLCVYLHTVCTFTHCVYIYTQCVKLYTVYKITQGSRSIWKNSPHLENFTLTPEVASATNIRYAPLVQSRLRKSCKSYLGDNFLQHVKQKHVCIEKTCDFPPNKNMMGDMCSDDSSGDLKSGRPPELWPKRHWRQFGGRTNCKIAQKLSEKLHKIWKPPTQTSPSKSTGPQFN